MAKYNAIVVGAGAPHLLALSGVGPRAELEAVSIPVVHDLPGVGKAFSDHPDILVTWVPRHRLDTEAQRDCFQAVLNFTATGSKYVGDLEVLPRPTRFHDTKCCINGTRIAPRLSDD